MKESWETRRMTYRERAGEQEREMGIAGERENWREGKYEREREREREREEN